MPRGTIAELAGLLSVCSCIRNDGPMPSVCVNNQTFEFKQISEAEVVSHKTNSVQFPGIRHFSKFWKCYKIFCHLFHIKTVLRILPKLKVQINTNRRNTSNYFMSPLGKRLKHF